MHERPDWLTDTFVIRVRRDEALRATSSSTNSVITHGKGVRDEQKDEEEEEVLLEASRIAQKIKSEIGPRSRKYDEVDFPLPPLMFSKAPIASTSALPMLPSIPSMGAASALQAFEQRKKAMQMNGAKKAAASDGKQASSSLLSSSLDSSSSESSSSSSSSSSSPSSSSSCSDSSSSSSNDSSSDSDSSSSSGSETDSSSSSSGHQESSPLKANGIPVQDWVPPGHGLARTQRNNRSRRQKRKAEEEERQAKLFDEAKARAEKRAKGESVDEDAVTKGWMLDTKGKKINGHANNTQRYKIVSRDGALVLPPGGGSLGILQKKEDKKSAPNGTPAAMQAFAGASNGKAQKLPEHSRRFVPAVREVAQETNLPPDDTLGDASTSFSARVPPPPPSQRNIAIPAGVRLTSIDCDDCYNGLESELIFDEEPEAGNEAFEAIQAQVKAALKAAKEREDREEEEREMLKRIKQDTLIAQWVDGKQWDDQDGGDNHYVDDSESIDEDVIDETDLDMAQSFMSELPMEFGKKSNWDGNDVVVPRQAQLLQPSNGLVELDYGEPEDALMPSTSLHEDIKRLRDLRDQAIAAKGINRSNDSDALQKARMIALASRKKAK